MKYVMPVGKMVLVEMRSRTDPAAKILLPENQSTIPDEKVVLAVGEEVKKVRPGDSILCLPNHGAAVDIPGVEKGTAIIPEEAVLAVFVDNPKRKRRGENGAG